MSFSTILVHIFNNQHLIGIRLIFIIIYLLSGKNIYPLCNHVYSKNRSQNGSITFSKKIHFIMNRYNQPKEGITVLLPSPAPILLVLNVYNILYLAVAHKFTILTAWSIHFYRPLLLFYIKDCYKCISLANLKILKPKH